MKTYKEVLYENEGSNNSTENTEVKEKDIIDLIKKETIKKDEKEKTDDNIIKPTNLDILTLFTGVIENIDKEEKKLELLSVYLTSPILNIIDKYFNRLFVVFDGEDVKFEEVIKEEFFKGANISIKVSGNNTWEWIKDINEVPVIKLKTKNWELCTKEDVRNKEKEKNEDEDF